MAHQILAAGTELGLFDHLDTTAPKTAPELATAMGLDAALLYRLLRAQAAIGLLAENAAHGFVLTGMGDLLRTTHPASLAPMARLEEGPQHYALWRHLPAMVKMASRTPSCASSVAWAISCDHQSKHKKDRPFSHSDALHSEASRPPRLIFGTKWEVCR